MPRNVLIMDVLDSLLVAVFRLVVGRGDLAPSLRALAADAGMSPASVVHHFGSRQHALQLVAARWARQRAEDLLFCPGAADLPALLPEHPEQVHDAAFDFALVAMARGHEGIASSMSDLRQARRERLGNALPDLDRADLDLVVAAVDGLMFALSLPFDALDPDRARAALARLVGLLPGELT